MRVPDDQPSAPDFSLESPGPHPVCGIDEVGRGPWAGPVVAAAVILDPAAIPEGLNDSKLLTAQRREALAAEIRLAACVGVGVASVAEIEAMNILQASFLAMRRAVAALAAPSGAGAGRRPHAAPGPPLPLPAGGRRRRPRPLDRRRLDRRQGDPRRDDGCPFATVPRLRLGNQHGLRHAGACGGVGEVGG